MTHWRKPLYTIETEFGVLRNVTQEDAEALECYPDVVMRFTKQCPAMAGYIYIPLMVLVVSVLIGGLRYFFGG